MSESGTVLIVLFLSTRFTLVFVPQELCKVHQTPHGRAAEGYSPPLAIPAWRFT